MNENAASTANISDSKNLDVVWILSSVSNKQCSDPKDRIFALNGILHALHLNSHFPTPDYSKPVEQVYFEAAKACILQQQRLRVLLVAPSLDRNLGLPSWVPEWGQFSTNDHYGHEYLTREFTATASAPCYSLINDQLRTLVVRAKVINRVAEVLRPEDYSSGIEGSGGTYAPMGGSDDIDSILNRDREEIIGLGRFLTEVERSTSVATWDTLTDALVASMTQDVINEQSFGPDGGIFSLSPMNQQATIGTSRMEIMLLGREQGGRAARHFVDLYGPEIGGGIGHLPGQLGTTRDQGIHSFTVSAKGYFPSSRLYHSSYLATGAVYNGAGTRCRVSDWFLDAW